jgi:hypothetical protein
MISALGIYKETRHQVAKAQGITKAKTVAG